MTIFNRFSLIISVIACSLLVSFAVWAKEKNLTTYTIRQVQHAYQLQLEEKPNEAIAVLEKTKTSRAYDQAYVHRMLGGLYWQTQQSALAIRSLTTAVEAKQLPKEQQRDTQRMLADILLVEGQYSKSEKGYVNLLPEYESAVDREWLWLRLAQSQYQQQKWSLVEKSIKKQQYYLIKAKLAPKVMPLNMMLAAQLSTKKWRRAIKTAYSLRELEPNNILWWKQLTTLYLQTDQIKKALTTLQQADRAGFKLSDQQLKLLAQLYAQLDVPFKAGETYSRIRSLEDSVELLQQQANNWQAAKEWDRAKKSWNKAANIDPKYYWQMALLQLQRREYDGALVSIEALTHSSAIKTYTKSQLAKVHIAETQAFNALGQRKQALDAITLANRLQPSANTRSWIKYLSID